ncbi:TonB-dependent receptor [Thalassomonas viridans]|uniref:TonB-dependent receptor n=1 Tax=Thalassomonas viridans TaxID=137584 RepID=A0AAE9Z2P5_9GAMM|nr:TonB-dependent receptor [Thalassomonas viridans]WDE04955.1 TonB-dependent receptor [Thalassomonas viridans]
MQNKQLLMACSLAASLSFPVWAEKITGQVVDHKGQAVAGAKITLKGDANAELYVTTDSSGAFTLDQVKPGAVQLTVEAKNYAATQKSLQLSNRDVADLQLVLSPSSIEVIQVQASPFNATSINSALPVNVLSSDELRIKQASTLGETLKNEVGVHSTYFGPVSSSPIIRGLDGPRVLVTQNGLDVGDASRVGPDHVVASETSTATQVEVLRGPATLFYGSGAIGGVVNVVDNRVPKSTDTAAEWLLEHNTVADENLASLSLDSGKDNIAVHLDGFWRESNDYEIAGQAEAAGEEHDEHEEHEEGEEHEEHEEHGESGKLANSASKSSGFTIGSSYLFDNGYLGFSYGELNREYGVPGHSHGGHEDEHEDDHEEHEGEEHEEHEGEEHEEAEAEDVYADMEQKRYQLLTELTFDQNFIQRLQGKLAYTDYQHQEIENGEVGTQFENESLEGRIDLYHQHFDGWQGAWTFHYKDSDFSAMGEEAFTPASTTKSKAIAWLEEKRFGDFLLQLGARYEHVTISADSLTLEGHEHEGEVEPDEEIHFDKQSFDPVSASVGGVWDFAPGYNLGMSLAYSQRAPSAAELFSYGPHIGTNTFEVGALFSLHDEGDGEFHPHLAESEGDLETSYNLDLTVRKYRGDFSYVLSVFYNHVEDYYYQHTTGLFFSEDHGHEDDEHEGDDHEGDEHEDEGLPVLVYRQADVDMYGAEIDVSYQLTPQVKTSVFADFVRGKLSDGGNLPRIPPTRIGSQFNYQGQDFDAELSASYYFKQDKLAVNETDTSGYLMLDANFNYYLEGFGNDAVLYLKGQNLTDKNARVHSSFLKDVAPLPGRGISIGIRGSF